MRSPRRDHTNEPYRMRKPSKSWKTKPRRAGGTHIFLANSSSWSPVPIGTHRLAARPQDTRHPKPEASMEMDTCKTIIWSVDQDRRRRLTNYGGLNEYAGQGCQLDIKKP